MSINRSTTNAERRQFAVERWTQTAERELTGIFLISQMIAEARANGTSNGRVTELREQLEACKRYYLKAVAVLERNGEPLPADMVHDAERIGL